MSVRRSAYILVLLGSSFLVLAATSCGSGKTNSPPPQPQPSYPSTPPVAITWSPSSSPLPAPPAQVPPPGGSNDFPLTVSGPADGATVTSPMNVVASANPKNPIFFIRVYVDQLAVYFTFTNSINTQIFVAPGLRLMLVFR